VDAPPDRVWAVLADFGQISATAGEQWMPAGCRYPGIDL
jgi:hypothetical protein